MERKEINEFVDFWRYTIGVNVIPADGVKKKTWISWKDDPRGNWQTQPIPQNIHDEWKEKGMFDKGVAVICGKVWHNLSKSHLYLCAIDMDNRKAIELIAQNGVESMANSTLVEGHDNPNKLHAYFYTTYPMPKKSSDATNLTLLEKMNNNEIPAIEMKGDGTHGIMYCTPSPHKDGSNYRILGVKEPMILDEIGKFINDICDQFSLGKDNKNKVPMKLLMEDDTKIIEGSNRHEALMRYAESLLVKYPNMERTVFRDMVNVKNARMCVPPLEPSDVDFQIKCAVEWISKRKEEKDKLQKSNKINYNRCGEESFIRKVSDYSKMRHVPITEIDIFCVTCWHIFQYKYWKDHRNHDVRIDE